MIEFLLAASLNSAVMAADMGAYIDVSPAPQKQNEALSPVVVLPEQAAYVVYDLNSGAVMMQQNADRPQPIASITKLMTAMIILDSHDLNEEVLVGPEAIKTPGAGVDLLLYETLTVRTLLQATLVSSANDAAVALAVHHAGSEAEFARVMNTHAEKKGLASADFYTATGLDLESENAVIQSNSMSAHDVLRMGRLAWEYEFIRIVGGEKEFFGTSIDGQFSHEKGNTNQLLGSFLSVQGLKTGYTEAAGQCLVTVAQYQSRPIMMILLGSESRFSDTKKLLSWAYDAHNW